MDEQEARHRGTQGHPWAVPPALGMCGEVGVSAGHGGAGTSVGLHSRGPWHSKTVRKGRGCLPAGDVPRTVAQPGGAQGKPKGALRNLAEPMRKNGDQSVQGRDAAFPGRASDSPGRAPRQTVIPQTKSRPARPCQEAAGDGAGHEPWGALCATGQGVPEGAAAAPEQRPCAAGRLRQRRAPAAAYLRACRFLRPCPRAGRDRADPPG